MYAFNTYYSCCGASILHSFPLETKNEEEDGNYYPFTRSQLEGAKTTISRMLFKMNNRDYPYVSVIHAALNEDQESCFGKLFRAFGFKEYLRIPNCNSEQMLYFYFWKTGL